MTLPPSVFDHYKSTVVDTHKPKIPKVLVYMVSALVIGFALVGAGVYKLSGRASSMLDGVAPGQTHAPVQAPATSTANRPAESSGGLYSSFNKDRPLSAADFVAVHPLAPWSAPLYRQIAEPTTFPRFSGCAAFNGQCKCFTQQATVIDVDEAMCLDVVVKNKRPFDPHHADYAAVSDYRVASVPERKEAHRGWSDLEEAGTTATQSTSYIPRNPL